MQNSISKERKEFLRKARNNKFLVLGTQILVLLSIIVAWEVLANMRNN